MSAYCFFDVTEVTDMAKLEEYREHVLATVEAFGGRYLTVGGKTDIVEGTWRPTYPVLIEFPSLGHAHQWYDSEQYGEIKDLRVSATRGHAVFIDGVSFEAVMGHSA